MTGVGKGLAVVLVLASVLAASRFAHAGSLSVSDRTALQVELIDYIDHRTIEEMFIYFDPKSAELLKLYPAHLHPRIVPVGDLIFLCADFRSESGEAVEVDFVAKSVDGEYRIVQTMVSNRSAIRRLMSRD